jgi:hypothetical protein
MKISETPTRELLRLLQATESARNPDKYALAALRREVARRLEQRIKREAESCK